MIGDHSRARALGALVVLVVALALVALWGRRLDARDPEMMLSASPWLGHYRLLATSNGRWRFLLPAGGLGAVLVICWPWCCTRLPARLLPPVSGAVGVGWAVALQATAGWSRVTRPMQHSAEYLAAVDEVGSVGEFLRTFEARLGDYPIHVQGHPPGQVLTLWGMERVGLGGSGPAAGLALVAAAVATAGVLSVARLEAGEAAMRRAAVFVGLVPAVIWEATSTDPVFSALAVGVVVAAFRAERSRGKGAMALAGVAGVLAATAMFFTYATPLFLAPAVLPAWRLARGRRWGPIATAVGSAFVVVALVAAAGFNIWDGLMATTEAYRDGVAAHRPFGFFVVANVVVLAVALGPAAVAGAAGSRHGRLAPLLIAAAVGVAVADLTGLSKGEVERIWLPFTPWLALAAAPLAARMAGARWWLAAQLISAAALQAVLRSPW